MLPKVLNCLTTLMIKFSSKKIATITFLTMYNQTCFKRPIKGDIKRDHLRKVAP